METVQVGLLLKDATVGYPSQASKTVIVTANGHVKFTNGFSMATGMQFTLEQWNEIVQFVDGQLLERSEENLGHWQPDWNAVDKSVNYVSFDVNNKVYGYRAEPDLSKNDGMWVCNENDDYFYCLGIKPPSNIHWTQSLTVRPGVSPK